MSDNIKNQFNNSTFNNPTFKFDSINDALELETRSKLLSYEIQDIYKQMNYQIDDKLDLGMNYFIAEQTIMGGIEKMRILVKCLYKNINTNVSKDEIQIFENEFNRNKESLNIDKGILLTNKDFENQSSHIKCLTQDQLSSGVLNIIDISKAFIKEYEKEEIYQRYINLSGKIKESNHDIVEYILDSIYHDLAYLSTDYFLHNNPKNLYTIFGDFGTGKSTIINKLCYEVSKMYITQKSIKKPLLIELKDFYNSKDLVSFVHGAFRKQYRGFETLPEVIMKEIVEGKFILFLDGFDEMTAQISVESRFENFNKLSILLNSKSACILTCRTSYFISQAEYRSSIPKLYTELGTFQGHVDSLGKKLDDKYINKGTLDYEEQTQIITNNIEITINPLTEGQIKTYIEKCSIEFREKCNSNTDEIYNFIIGIYDLGDLITKPILLSIITDTILLEGKNYLKSDIKYGHAALYEKYTALILKRDWGKGKSRHYLTMVQRNKFAEAIAITMLYKGILEVKYDDILSVINLHKDILSEFKDKDKLSNSQTQEFIASDIRICSFLKRTDENTFKFVHKSFMEFFVAQFIVTQLLNQENSNVLSDKILNKEILFFVGGFGVYKAEIQKKIFTVWRKNQKSKDQTLKRNLSCAFILSRIEHDNSHKSTFNISDVNIESISIRKIKFRKVEYNKINFINTDFTDVSIIDSIFINVQIQSTKDIEIKRVTVNNSKFSFVKLEKKLLESCTFELNKMVNFECNESEYLKCKISDELTSSKFKNCSFNDCPEINLSGKDNVLESVIITNSGATAKNGHLENLGKLILQGFYTLQSCRITYSKIEINDTIIFTNCEFKNCQIIGNGNKNCGQFINCKFDNCLFVNFYIEYDYLFTQKKDTKILSESLFFHNCTGIILTNTEIIHAIASNLLVFNIVNYKSEINLLIKQKEEVIRTRRKAETVRKEKLKLEIEVIRNVILTNKGLKNEEIISKKIQKEIDLAIKEHKYKNALVITEKFDERREVKLINFLKEYSNL